MGRLPTPQPCVRLQDRVKPSFLRARHGPVSRKWLALPRETRVHECFLFYGLGEVHVQENKASKKGAVAPCTGPPACAPETLFLYVLYMPVMCHHDTRWEVFLFSYFLLN